CPRTIPGESPRTFPALAASSAAAGGKAGGGNDDTALDRRSRGGPDQRAVPEQCGEAGLRRRLAAALPGPIPLSEVGGTMRWINRMALASLMLLLAASAVSAAEEEPAPGWQFEAMPYLWISGAFGTVQVRGRTAHVHTTLGDVLTLLWHGDAFTMGGYFAARYDRWSFFTDAYGGFLDQSVIETVPTPRFPNVHVRVGATLKLNPVIADFAFG